MNDLIQSSFDYAALPVDAALTARAAAERIKLRLKRTVEDIIEIGRELTAVKEQLPHGSFLPWIAAEFEMSRETSDNFMSVYKRFGDGKLVNFTNFKPSILYALAAPSTPAEVIDRAVEKAESGEKVTVADVKDWKAELEAERQARLVAEQRSEEWRQSTKFHKKQAEAFELELIQERQRSAAAIDRIVEKEIIPADYEHLKKTERELRNDLADLKQQQREMIQQQVVAKLKEREAELSEMDRKVKQSETLLAGLQTQIDRYSMQQRELKVHLDTIEKARSSMALLAANLEGFGEVIDPEHELRQWRALADMLRHGAVAIEHFIGEKKPALTVVHGA